MQIYKFIFYLDRQFTPYSYAEKATGMYLLLDCCKFADVNPREWLTDILTKIPGYNLDYSLDLADLLPHNWKKSKGLQ